MNNCDSLAQGWQIFGKQWEKTFFSHRKEEKQFLPANIVFAT